MGMVHHRTVTAGHFLNFWYPCTCFCLLLQLVEVALGQGIVFPVTCVGHLIALAAETAEAVRNTALRLVTLINSR